MKEYCMIEVAFSNDDEINKVIDILLENKLASGCQKVLSDSIWNWKNQRESSKEIILKITTTKDNIKEIYDEIRKVHSYKTFEFAIFEIKSINKDYLSWIEEECKELN